MPNHYLSGHSNLDSIAHSYHTPRYYSWIGWFFFFWNIHSVKIDGLCERFSSKIALILLE